MEDEEKRGCRGRLGFLVGTSLAVLVAAGVGGVLVFTLATNPFSRVGEVGYVYEEPRFFGRGGYLGVLEGPGSFGGSLRNQKVVNISVLPETFSEEFDVRVGGEVARVTSEVNLRVDPAGVKRIVEEFGAGSWYQASVRATVVRTLRATLAEGLSGDRDVAFAVMEAVISSALEEALERRRVPVFVEGVFIRRIVWAGEVASSGEPEGEADSKISPAVEPTKMGAGATSEAVADGMETPGVMPPTLMDVSHAREFRGLWLATVTNVDWPSRAGLSPEQQRAELVEYLDIMEDLHFNALLLQIRPASDALYRTELEPWSRWLTGEADGDPGYDPLEFAIEEARSRGIEVHAWFNPYRALTNKSDAVPEGHVAKMYPQYARTYGRYLWMDPGAEPVQEWIVKVIRDVVARYDVAGVHLDDYFYPYPTPGQKFDDSATYAAYVKGSGTMALNEWRRHNIHTLVQRISMEIRALKPGVKFGISPFGLYRPGEPEGTKGLDQVEAIFSDPKRWLDRGWIDYVTPQLYWKEDSNLKFSRLLEWWGGANSLRRHIYAGSSLGRIDEGWPISEFEIQVEASRVAAIRERQSLGNIFFGAKVFKGAKGAELQELFKKSIYPEAALPPVMGWLEDAPGPPRPRQFEEVGGELRWDPPPTGTERWTLYRRDESTNGWILFKVMPGEQLRIAVEAGTYALCAVDPMMRESVGVVAEVGRVAPPEEKRVLPIRPEFEDETEGEPVEVEEA